MHVSNLHLMRGYFRQEHGCIVESLQFCGATFVGEGWC